VSGRWLRETLIARTGGASVPRDCEEARGMSAFGGKAEVFRLL